jgi:MFS transporter, Spinster family, sphingosine-1-phosphate transporter
MRESGQVKRRCRNGLEESRIIGNFMRTNRMRALALLTLSAAVGFYAKNTLSPLQEAMRVSLGFSDNQVSLLQGWALALPMIVLSVPLGLAIDRYSRVRIIFIVLVVALIGTVLTATVSSFEAMFFSRCLVALAWPGTAIAAASINSDLFGPSQRGKANMVLTIGQVVGQSAAFVVGGILLAHTSPAGDGWRGVMWWMAAPIAIFMAIGLLLREPKRTEVETPDRSVMSAFVKLWHYRRAFVSLVAGMALIYVVDMAVAVWSAPAFSRAFGMRSDRIGTIIGIALLLSGIGGPLAGGFLADRWLRTHGPSGVMGAMSAIALISAPAGLFALFPWISAAGIGLTVFNACGTAIGVMEATLWVVVIPNELRGLAMSLSGALMLPLCLGLGPLSVSMLSGALGGPMMIGRALAFTCIGVSLIGALAFLLGKDNLSLSGRTPIYAV